MIHMVSQWERTECNSSLIMIHSYTNIVLERVSDHMGCNVHICMLSLRTNEGIYRGKKSNKLSVLAYLFLVCV